MTMNKFGHPRGLYALACDEEACTHYEINTHGVVSLLWKVRCYLRGFMGL
jgi:hypothetical protein